MTERQAKRILYAFILSQPLVFMLLAMDQGLGVLDIPRSIIHLSLSLPWGLGALASIAALRKLGASVGREWAHWSLAVALVYGVHFFASQEIYLSYLAPVNLIIFPLLAILLSHISFRENF